MDLWKASWEKLSCHHWLKLTPFSFLPLHIKFLSFKMKDNAKWKITTSKSKNFNKGGQIKYPTMHHFQLYYQRADAKIASFWCGCARVESSASARVSKIKIILSISSIRSVFRSLLGLVYLSWSRNVMHVSCLHSLSKRRSRSNDCLSSVQTTTR